MTAAGIRAVLTAAVLASVLIVHCTPVAAEELDSSQFTIGACGGIMTGYDGQQYPCEADRKPVCELSSKRCVCLERTDCGGTRNEPF